jgi:hypothetical protein
MEGRASSATLLWKHVVVTLFCQVAFPPMQVERPLYFFLHLLLSTVMSKVVTHNQRKPSKGGLVTPLFAGEDDGTPGLGEV